VLYLFRSTTAQLCGHLQHIEESGDTPLWPVFVGGRDWIIICRKAGE
jgi:hypothetical protein